MAHRKLYNRDANGQVRVWEIWQSGNEIVMQWGVQGGAMQEKREQVPFGKVNRTLNEQIELQINSRINKQKDKGYREHIPDKSVNTLGFQKPMLALREERQKNVDYSSGVFVQRKYDGHRCLITNDEHRGLVSYSRQGKEISTIDHILQTVDIPVGVTIDGELYLHGEKLQTISSLVKKKQERTNELQFHAYDILDSSAYSARLDLLRSMIPELVVPTFKVTSREDALELFSTFRRDGYEGAIVRLNNAGYQTGKRSKSLLKIKEVFDGEFPVIDITPSVDGWGVLHLMDSEGRKFKVTAPGTHEEKCAVFVHSDAYIGREIQIEWYSFTERGVPFHPVALRWKEDV